jgi:hypothetical protein
MNPLIRSQIPAAWVIALLPHLYAAGLSKSFDNRNPRSYINSIEKDQGIDKAVSLPSASPPFRTPANV